MVVYICTKFNKSILNDIRITERTGKVNGRRDGRLDRRMDGDQDIICSVLDGRIKIEMIIHQFQIIPNHSVLLLSTPMGVDYIGTGFDMEVQPA